MTETFPSATAGADAATPSTTSNTPAWPNRIAKMQDRTLITLLVLLAAVAYYALGIQNYGEVVPYRTYLGH